VTEDKAMHPFRKILAWLPKLDFAVLAHGWARHGRDYLWIVEDCLGGDPGQHEITLTHCVHLDYESRVRDSIWAKSWSDDFIDYQRWQQAGEPAGYVWGTNWSNAYPGVEVIEDSETARQWIERLGYQMYELTLETDRFFLRLVFHSARSRKLGDSTETISRCIIPLDG
jgi:hypothetical protein